MELPGFPDPSIRDYEIRHGDLSRRAAAEGMVLLKNENHLLPLKKGEKVDLYGPGAIVTVRGGYGVWKRQCARDGFRPPGSGRRRHSSVQRGVAR